MKTIELLVLPVSSGSYQLKLPIAAKLLSCKRIDNNFFLSFISRPNSLMEFRNFKVVTDNEVINDKQELRYICSDINKPPTQSYYLFEIIDHE